MSVGKGDGANGSVTGDGSCGVLVVRGRGGGGALEDEGSCDAVLEEGARAVSGGGGAGCLGPAAGGSVGGMS